MGNRNNDYLYIIVNISLGRDLLDYHRISFTTMFLLKLCIDLPLIGNRNNDKSYIIEHIPNGNDVLYYAMISVKTMFLQK